MSSQLGSGPCRCCGLTDALFGPRRSFNNLPTAAIVCDLCAHHQGSHEADQSRRSRGHLEMWREHELHAIEQLTECHQDAVAALEGRLRAAQEELERRPVRVVNQNLDQEEVNAAHEAEEAAYRSRDWAYVDLARLHMLHFEASGGKCRCGKAWERCQEGAILDLSKSLRRWERAQADRQRRGDVHMLPQGHPGIVDARWDPDDDVPEPDFLYHR